MKRVSEKRVVNEIKKQIEQKLYSVQFIYNQPYAIAYYCTWNTNLYSFICVCYNENSANSVEGARGSNYHIFIFANSDYQTFECSGIFEFSRKQSCMAVHLRWCGFLVEHFDCKRFSSVKNVDDLSIAPEFNKRCSMLHKLYATGLIWNFVLLRGLIATFISYGNQETFCLPKAHIKLML